MKIIFLGTPQFAVPSLDILVKNKYDIAAVITAPGKNAGRGLKIKQSAIKEYADEKGLLTFQPEKFSDTGFLNQIRTLNADLFIVVAFRMLPEVLWKMPPLGTFNLHGSLLPDYRGAAPINRAIMNGETETGVTTFFLKHEIDTGNIIFSEKIAIHPNETAGELHDRMMVTGAQLVLKTVKTIESQSVTTQPQEALADTGSNLKKAPKIFTADCQLNWELAAHQLHNQIRGLSPFPGAFTWLSAPDGKRILLKIHRTALTSRSDSKQPGTIEAGEENIFIRCNDFYLELLEVQQEGKKRMTVKDFIKGFRTEKAWKAE